MLFHDDSDRGSSEEDLELGEDEMNGEEDDSDDGSDNFEHDVDEISDDSDFDLYGGCDYSIEDLDRFLLTFHNGIYDDEIDDALCHGIGVDDTNMPDDWEERKAIALENLEFRLGEDIFSAQLGEFSGLHITSNSDPPDIDCYAQVYRSIEDHPLLYHNQSIDQDWEELSVALRDNTQNRVNNGRGNILIQSVEMRKKVVAKLARSLVGKIDQSIQFINTNLCRQGIISLSTLVEQSPDMDFLNLTRNPIDDVNSALRLSGVLKAHPGIIKLDLSHCNIGNNMDILSVILQSDVKHINLSHNNIDSLGAIKITDYLEGNPPVNYLSLAENRFGDEDAIVFSQALNKNTNLTRLCLSWNNFTSTGAKELFSNLYDSSSLNAISESNHTCNIDIFPCIDYSHIGDLLVTLWNLDRASKILIALHAKESLLKYLADVPVELMPEVLAFLQREADPGKLTNMMYGTMRWWEMPSLYSYRNCVFPSTKRKRDDINN